MMNHAISDNINLLVAIGLLVVLMVLARVLGGKQAAYPYQKRDVLFTPAERSFLGVLEQSVGGQYRIFGKVRLGDILYVPQGASASRQQSARNRINQKHVDFVLCDPRTLQVVCVLELDDRSHKRPDRQERDRFVDNALAAAGVPILHIPAQRSYHADELRKQIAAALKK